MLCLVGSRVLVHLKQAAEDVVDACDCANHEWKSQTYDAGLRREDLSDMRFA